MLLPPSILFELFLRTSVPGIILDLNWSSTKKKKDYVDQFSPYLCRSGPLTWKMLMKKIRNKTRHKFCFIDLKLAYFAIEERVVAHFRKVKKYDEHKYIYCRVV